MRTPPRRAMSITKLHHPSNLHSKTLTFIWLSCARDSRREPSLGVTVTFCRGLACCLEGAPPDRREVRCRGGGCCGPIHACFIHACFIDFGAKDLSGGGALAERTAASSRRLVPMGRGLPRVVPTVWANLRASGARNARLVW